MNKHNNPSGENVSWRQTLVPMLSLFTSMGTLLCCALPALLVTLGMGAALAGLVGAAPWITAISDHKKMIFIIAAMLITFAWFMIWRARNAPCPADPAKANACARLRIFSKAVMIFSTLIYAIGFFFAFLAADIFYG